MFQWGIIGGGFISSQFAKGLKTVPDMKVGALASRSGRNPYGIYADRYYYSYEELAEDPKIQAVYIGTIHPEHASCAKICLERGKPVLCEKPVTMNERELQEVLELAEKNNVFFMEAMWTRFIPAVRWLREAIRKGTYGKVHNIHITFGGPADPKNRRLLEAGLGGGALLDVGVYGMNTAAYLLGEHPRELHAWAEKTEETVDLSTCIQAVYPGGALADMVFSINRKVNSKMVLVTDLAELEIPYFWRPDTIYELEPNHDFCTELLREKRTFSIEGNGYHYEALEVREAIRQGKTESLLMPWEESRKIMGELDQIRAVCGIQYPQDL